MDNVFLTILAFLSIMWTLFWTKKTAYAALRILKLFAHVNYGAPTLYDSFTLLILNEKK